MASKKKLLSKKLSFDSELNFPDLPDFDFEPPKDNRSAVVKVAQGIKAGIKQTATNSSFIRATILKALPEGYGEIAELTDKSSRSLKDLYNTIGNDVRPVATELKRVTTRLMPTGEKYIPKSIATKMKEWAATAEAVRRSPNYDPQEALLQQTLQDMLKTQMIESARQTAVEDIRSDIRATIEQSRHRDSLAQAASMRDGIMQLVAYQNNVTAVYQRKSLEVQYRHYFTAVDSLAEQKKVNAELVNRLDLITKNTGLPDYAKLKTSERFGEAVRNKFIDKINDNFFDKRRNFVKNFGGEIGKRARQKVNGILGGLSSIIGMGNTIADNTGDHAPQIDRYDAAGNIIGGAGASYGGGKLGEWGRKKLENYKGMQKGARMAGHYAANVQQYTTDWARGDTGDYLPFIGNAIRGVKDSALAANRLNAKIETDSLRTINEPMPYTRHANKAITEIIPGFLSRILRELQVTRTGDTNTELTSYDYTSNKFDVASVAKKNAFKKIVDASGKQYNKEEVDALVRKIDPDNMLTQEQRDMMGARLLHDNLDPGKTSSGKRLSERKAWLGHGSTEHASKFADVMKKYFENDEDGSKQGEFTSRFTKLGRYIQPNSADLQDHANAGLYEYLQEAEMLNPDGTINVKKINRYFLNDEYTPGMNPVGPNGPGGKKKKKNQNPNVPTPIPQPTPNPHPLPPTPVIPPTPIIQQSQFDATEIIRTINDNSKLIVEEMEKSSTKSVTDLIHETLLRVEKRLNEGIPTVQLNDPNNPNGPGPGGGGGGGNPWYNPSVGGLLGGIGKLAWKGTKFAWNTSNKISGGLWSAGKKGIGLGFGALKRTSDMFVGLRDVFVPGEDEPRLLAWKLRAGHYLNKEDGKTIHSIRDITGPVVDEEGNEVLSAKEAKKAYVKGRLGKVLLTASGAVISAVWNTARSVAQLAPALVSMAVKGVTWGTKKAWNLTDMPQDVYVKGKKDPVLLKVTMQTDGYFSQRTQKVIKRVSDIDGPVVDEEGDVVLSKKMLAGGLYDKRGKPIKTGLSKFLDFGGNIIGGAAKLGGKIVGGVFRGVSNVVSGISGGISSLLGGFVGKNGLIFAGSKKIVTELELIHKLLDERLPGKKVAGDLSGDGIRDGSVEDLRRKRKERDDEKDKKKEKAEKDAAAKAGGGLGILGGLKGMLSKLFGGDKEKEDDDGIDGSDLLNAAGDATGSEKDGKKKRRRRRGGRRPPLPPVDNSWKAKGIRSAKTAGKLGWQGASWLGRGALTLAGLGGAASLVPGGGAAIGAAATGVGGMLTGAASVAGTALAGLASIVASPLVLAGLAIAAVGVAGYYGYKRITRDDLDTLSRVRYVQYGFVETDTKNVHFVFGLEQMLEDAVTYNQDGIAQLNEKKLDLKKMVEDWGVDINNPRDKEKWVRWFANRFKPIYLVHMTVLHKVAPKAKLDSVDGDLKGVEKKQYLDGARFPGGPYDEMVSPLPGEDTLPATPEMVAAEITKAYEIIAKDGKDGPKMGTTIERSLDSKLIGAGLAAPGTLLAAKMKKGGDGLADPKSLADLNNKTDLTKIDKNGMMANKGLLAVASVGTASLGQTFNGEVDGLTAVRFKAYGLVELEADKVRSLAILEREVQKGLKANGEKIATWQGDPTQLLGAVGPVFGVVDSTSSLGSSWIQWFNNRFLPVFLNYATGLYSNIGSFSAEGAPLKPNAKVEIAQMILSATTQADGSAKSVFLISTSPWEGYALNSDPETTTKNLQGLKDTAKTSTLPEKVGKERTKNADGTYVTNASGTVQTGAGSGRPSSVMEKIFGREATDTDRGSGVRGVIGRMFGAGPITALATGGNAIVQPGNGTGGDINALPMPTSNGTYESVKELINAASAMTGVDPKLMATMAAVESGFNWQVKAKTSSATGLYQFIDETWKSMLRKYGKKYGIHPDTLPTDPRANALMGAEFLKENAEALKGTKQNLTDTDLYLAHFLGAGGAKKFLSSKQDHIAADVMPGPAASNKPIFYTITGKPRTFGETYAEINRRIQSRGKQFGLSSGGGAEGMVPSAPVKAVPSTADTPSVVSSAVPVVAAGAPSADKSGAGLGKPEVALPLPTKKSKGGADIPASVAGIGSGYAGSVMGGDNYLDQTRADVAGVNPVARQRVATQRAQADFQRSEDPGYGKMVAIQEKQLGSQLRSEEWLKKICDGLVGVAKATEQAAKQPDPTDRNTPTSVAPPKPVQRPTPMARPPVSMLKPVS